MSPITTLLFAAVVHAQLRPDGNGPWNGNGGRCWQDNSCDDSSGNNASGNEPSTQGYDEGGMRETSRIITIHAVLASLVWVFLIPVGGILIRSGIKSPWILRLHGILQTVSYFVYIVAVGMGIYLIRALANPNFNFWDDPHTRLGIAILALAFIQSITGILHHLLFKRRAAAAKKGIDTKRPGRTIPGYIHLWLGRSLIILGVVNGGLGLRLAAGSPYASNTRSKVIAYSVCSGVMALVYVTFVLLGEKRRSRDMAEPPRQRHRTFSARGDSGGLQGRRSDTPLHRHPPSYEISQQSVPKQLRVARYF